MLAGGCCAVASQYAPSAVAIADMHGHAQERCIGRGQASCMLQGACLCSRPSQSAEYRAEYRGEAMPQLFLFCAYLKGAPSRGRIS